MSKSKMRDHIDVPSIIAEIRIEKKSHRGSFMLVEGKKDFKSLYKHVSSADCSIIFCGGKENALEAIDVLINDCHDNIVCVLDSDHDKPEPNADDIIYTECHDLDVLIFSSNALKNYLIERADEKKIKTAKERYGCDERDIIYKAALPIGVIRYINRKYDLRINFRDIDYAFINEADLSCDKSILIDQLIYHSKNIRIERSELERKFEIVIANATNFLVICQGHDLSAILGISLIRLFADIRNIKKDCPDPRTRGSEIEMGLRLAFDYECFKETSLYNKIRSWETRSGYKVVK